MKFFFFSFVVLSPPLYLQFNDNYTEERKAIEQTKETAWNTHFTVYGRGSMMYRTSELYELIFQGIPDSLRNELWLIFSGAIHDVSEDFLSIDSYWFFFLKIEISKSECLSEISSSIFPS
jgi:hypothetical protein